MLVICVMIAIKPFPAALMSRIRCVLVFGVRECPLHLSVYEISHLLWRKRTKAMSALPDPDSPSICHLAPRPHSVPFFMPY
jgi:hypothetical protein